MIKKQFYFLLIYIATWRLVGMYGEQYSYQLFKPVGTVHYKMISNPQEDELLPFLDTIFPPNTKLVERISFESLIKIHAKAKSSRPISPSRIAAAVEDQFRKFYQKGMKEEDLKAKFGKETMKEVREEVTAHYTNMLLCYDFINNILLEPFSTPAQIDDFYHTYIAPQSIKVPAKVFLLQIVCYPTDGTENLDGIIETVNELYYTLTALSDTAQKKAALIQAVKEYYTREDFTVRYSYLPNSYGAPGLTSEEIPIDVQKVMHAKGITELAEGQLIAPHTFINENGQKGVKMIFVAERSPAQRMTLSDDYVYISLVFQQTQRNANLMQWWRKHKKETKVYG